jgi:membrane protease YdiL (CAAX protease family)
MLTDSIRRGLAAGLAAGLIAGVFAFLVGEPALRDAIELESQAAVPTETSSVDDEPLVPRRTQEALLPVATGIVGTAVGGLFGLAWMAARPRLRERSDWLATRTLAATGWAALVALPAVLVPANPPGVGDPGTVGGRTATYLLVLAVGLVLAVALGWLAHRLHDRGVPGARRTAGVTVAGAVGVLLLALVLPDHDVTAGVPADLLWSFRLATLGTQTVLWLGIGLVFGLLVERGTRRDEAGQPDATVRV